MEFDKTLLAGSTGLMLLKLLEQEDMYGYQMIETLRSRSEHAFDLKAETLYPLLHTLEQKGYITARDEPSAAGRPRRYYHLTDAGRMLYEENLEDWRRYRAVISKLVGLEEEHNDEQTDSHHD